MTFQVSDFKGNHFLKLLDDNHLPIKPNYMKGRSWLKLVSYLNSLCTRATRAITNHAPICKNHLRFFLRQNSVVHAEIIQLNQDDIYFMSVKDLTSIGILIGCL